MLREFDSVVLTVAMPDAGLPAGAHGAICDLREGDDHCFVEFFDDHGKTVAVEPVRLADLAPRPAPSTAPRL